MNCERNIDAQRYYDDELVGEMGRQFESHLASCADCRATVDASALLSRTLNAALRPEMPPVLTSQIIRAWKLKQSQAFDRGVRRFAEFLTAAAASVMLFVWLGHATPYRRGDERLDAPSHEWEAVALVNHDSSSTSEDAELVQVAQFMARDLSH